MRRRLLALVVAIGLGAPALGLLVAEAHAQQLYPPGCPHVLAHAPEGKWPNVCLRR